MYLIIIIIIIIIVILKILYFHPFLCARKSSPFSNPLPSRQSDAGWHSATQQTKTKQRYLMWLVNVPLLVQRIKTNNKSLVKYLNFISNIKIFIFSLFQ